MSRRNAFVGACLLVICCVCSMSGQQPAASASTRNNFVVPPLVNFSGVLTDLNGNPLTKMTGVTFFLYKDEQGGAPLWMETQNAVPDKNGHYTVMLGSTTGTGLPSDIFVAGEARWLGVQPQGQGEQPRILLLSVPYALKAGDAQTVGGLPPSAFLLAATPNASANSAASPGVAAQPLAPGTTPVTTAGGTINKLAKFDATADVTSSQVFDNGTNVGIGNTAPVAKLDVTGTATVRGLLSLPATGTAIATAGKNSQPIKLTASVFNSGTAAAVAQNFQWQAEPVGNNTTTTSGTLNLLYSSGTAALAETGLKVASNGRITFASGQTFPGTGKGNGTVTSVGSGAGLTGGPITGSGTLSIDPTVVPRLNTSNTFTGNQTVNGNLSATGLVTGTAFNIGNNLFAFGSYANQNAFLGFAGNATTTGSYNTASGYQALAVNTTGNFNTASGDRALASNTTGMDNTASGFEALYFNTTGSYNTATGTGALLFNTTGSSNTAFGEGALNSNTTGSYNTATPGLVANTTGGANTASGFGALSANTTGGSNTAIGFVALDANTTGSYNTAVGESAGFNFATGKGPTTGAFSTFVGAGATATVDGLLYATAIGYDAQVSENNALVLGRTGTAVGIGTSAPSNVFTVGQGAGNAIADGWDTYSSRRWKTNIQPLYGALAKIEQLRGVSYDLKANGKHEVGVIAEEVGAVVPEVVTWEKNGTDAQSVDYGRLTALLIEATKEQQAVISEQQAQIASLTRQVKTIQATLKANGRRNSAVRTAKAEGTTVRQ